MQCSSSLVLLPFLLLAPLVASRPALFTITRVTALDRSGKDYVDDGYAIPDDGYGVPEDGYGVPKPSTPTPDYAAPSYTSSVKPCYYKPTTTTTTTTTTAAPSYNAPSSSKGGFPDLFGFTKGLFEGVGRGVEDLKQLIKPDEPEGYGCLEAPGYAAPETETYFVPEDAYGVPSVPDSDSYVAPEDSYQPPATTSTTSKPEYLELAPRTETHFEPEV